MKKQYKGGSRTMYVKDSDLGLFAVGLRAVLQREGVLQYCKTESWEKSLNSLCQRFLAGCRDAEEAYDVLQDVYVRFLEKAENIFSCFSVEKHAKTMDGFIYQVLTYSMMNGVSKKNRERKEKEKEVNGLDLEEIGGVKEVGYVEQLHREEVMKRMSETDRYIVERLLEGHNQAEIGKMLGVSAVAVYNRLKKLKEAQ